MESGFEMDVRAFLARPPFNLHNVSKDDLQLFCEALTHDSYSNEAANMDPPRIINSYERLEFLGDAILEFLVCEYIFCNTDLTEGPMTSFKQEKVANEKLSEAILSRGIGIDQLMRVGNGHIGQHKEHKIEANMRADCFEALIAATYLAYGMDETRRVVREALF